MEAGDMNTPGHGMSGGVCTVHVLLMLCTSLCGALLCVVPGKFTEKSGFVCLCRRPVVRLGAMVLKRVGQAHAL